MLSSGREAFSDCKTTRLQNYKIGARLIALATISRGVENHGDTLGQIYSEGARGGAARERTRVRAWEPGADAGPSAGGAGRGQGRHRDAGAGKDRHWAAGRAQRNLRADREAAESFGRGGAADDVVAGQPAAGSRFQRSGHI